MLPIHGLHQHPHLVEAIHGHAVLEVVDEAEAAGVLVGVHALQNEQVEVVVFVALLVRLRLGLELALEVPRLFLGLLLMGKNLLHHHIGRVEILIQQITGGLQNIPEVLHVLGGLIAGELRRRIKGRHVQREQIANGVEVFRAVETSKNGATAGAGECLAAVGKLLGDLFDEGLLLIGRRLFRFLRRHFTEVDLIEDVLEFDQRVRFGHRKRERVETTVALLLFGAVAVVAVGLEKMRDRFAIGSGKDRSGCTEEQGK